MPALFDFSNNAFLTRPDFFRAARAFIEPLDRYKSPQCARIKVSPSTGAGFSETAAQLEGFARPLWVVANLLRSAGSSQSGLETWIEGMRAGTDPQSSEYWGDLRSFDQRMVEMESIAYALLSNPTAFNFSDDETVRKNLIAWLRQINEHDMPQSNWLWFRVLVNLALVQVLGVPLEEVKHHIDNSLRTLDTFYLGEGWSSDGLWCDERKQADYYSGSFAIQFAQLLYVKFAPNYDEKRTAKYKELARQFAKTYWRYFGPSGAAIPFGRSLTYRFAFTAFWAAVVISNIDLPHPLNQVGTVKGLLVRHLRWWAQQPHIFNTDGTLNIGYAYPNMYLAEDYTSPHSVYWCLKSFIVLGIPDDHFFWGCEELPYPKTDTIRDVELLWPPRQILCNTPEHHFLISSGQSTNKRFKAREAKYGKFAYSSAFGFSVPCGPFLEQIAPDSTLSVSFHDNEESWKVHWDPYDVRSEMFQVGGEETVTLVSVWRPWKGEDLTVKTRLIPPVKQWPGWHIRVHRVDWTPKIGTQRLRLVDSGFTVSSQTSQDISIFEQTVRNTSDAMNAADGWYEDESSAFVVSESGASGIVNLTPRLLQMEEDDSLKKSKTKPSIIRADPNTNLLAQRSLIPSIQHTIVLRNQTKVENIQYIFVTGVFAIEAFVRKSPAEILQLWQARPKSYTAGDTISFSSL